MNFKDLNQENKDFFKKIYLDKSISWDERMDILREFTK